VYDLGEEERRGMVKGLEWSWGGVRSMARKTVAKEPEPRREMSSSLPWSIRVPMRGVWGGRMEDDIVGCGFWAVVCGYMVSIAMPGRTAEDGRCAPVNLC